MNFQGHNPLDIAHAWADPRVLDIMTLKMDGLPAASDKKKGGKGGKGAAKGGGKRPTSVPPADKENAAVSLYICLIIQINI